MNCNLLFTIRPKEQRFMKTVSRLFRISNSVCFRMIWNRKMILLLTGGSNDDPDVCRPALKNRNAYPMNQCFSGHEFKKLNDEDYNYMDQGRGNRRVLRMRTLPTGKTARLKKFFLETARERSRRQKRSVQCFRMHHVSPACKMNRYRSGPEHVIRSGL